jgi:hypothetical protein
MRLLRSLPLLLLPALLDACAAMARAGGEAAGPPRTRLVVHVVAHDAKLIGSAVGGVRITVRDASSGEVLAQGIHEGSTGDTRRIVQEPRARGATVYETDGAARWETSLVLVKPTRIEVVAEGPLGYPDQMARATKTLLMLPRQDVSGDGLVLELHGYVLDLVVPDSMAAVPSALAIPVRVQARLLCSCPTQPGGLWEPPTIIARAWKGEEVAGEATLFYSGQPSVYEGSLPALPPGEYALEVTAANARAVTFGVVRRRLVVAPSTPPGAPGRESRP